MKVAQTKAADQTDDLLFPDGGTDRYAATVAAWLRAHPGVEVVSRDRSPAYAQAATEGASGALAGIAAAYLSASDEARP